MVETPFRFWRDLISVPAPVTQQEVSGHLSQSPRDSCHQNSFITNCKKSHHLLFCEAQKCWIFHTGDSGHQKSENIPSRATDSSKNLTEGQTFPHFTQYRRKVLALPYMLKKKLPSDFAVNGGNFFSTCTAH